jgi:AcrR family transcriptional regulator
VTLTRQAVIEAAIDIARREGVSAVTMRSLGAVLGVQAMSLYTHVRSKDDVILGMVEELCGRFTALDLPLDRHADPLTKDLIRARRIIAIATRLTAVEAST